MKVNDKVVFKAQVIRQCNHDKAVAGMKGIVLEIKGKVAKVDTMGSYPNEEGDSIQFIPIANLARVAEKGNKNFGENTIIDND